MEDYQEEALVNCLINSYVPFEPLDVTDYLLESEILDRDEVTKIRTEITPWERVQLLLSFVKRKEANMYDELIKALKLWKKYDELVKDIQTSASHFQKCSKKVEELLQTLSPEENYMFLDMLLSVAVSLNANDSLKICRYLPFSDESIDQVRTSENPGIATMNICRKTRIVKVSNIKAFRDLLNSLSLVHQLAIVDRYIQTLESPELELEIAKIEPDVLLDTVKQMLQDRKIWFKVGQKLSSMFQKAYDGTLLANIELDSCVLTLKVPTGTALRTLHRDFCSEKLAFKVLALILPHVQDQCLDETADARNAKITLELNEHVYCMSKSRFGETEELQIQDDPMENCNYEGRKGFNYPDLPGALGPEIKVTITRSFPDTLLASLKIVINDNKISHIRETSLRTFFYQNFEDIVCTKIRDGSKGVSFVLKVSTVSALHRLHTSISKGELAENILSAVKDAVGKNHVKSARICVELDKDDYKDAQKHFETFQTSIQPLEPFEEHSSPVSPSQGNPSDPLYLDPESFEMVQQLFQDRKDYERTLSKSGTFGLKPF